MPLQKLKPFGPHFFGVTFIHATWLRVERHYHTKRIRIQFSTRRTIYFRLGMVTGNCPARVVLKHVASGGSLLVRPKRSAAGR